MTSGAWVATEDEQLQKPAYAGFSLRAIADKMKRGTSSVRSRAIKLHIPIALDRNPMKTGTSSLSRRERCRNHNE